MKISILLIPIFLLLTHIGSAQKAPPETCLGLPFGSTLAAVRARMTSVHAARLLSDSLLDSSATRMLLYEGGSLAEHNVREWRFLFISDGLVQANIKLQATSRTAISTWEDAVKMLRLKYGKQKSLEAQDLLASDRAADMTNEDIYESLNEKLYLSNVWDLPTKGHGYYVSCSVGNFVDFINIVYGDIAVSPRATPK